MLVKYQIKMDAGKIGNIEYKKLYYQDAAGKTMFGFWRKMPGYESESENFQELLALYNKAIIDETRAKERALPA